MTVMALADRHSELFGPRVVGVCLVSTSTGRLADLTFGLPAAVLPVTRRVLPWLTRTVRRRPTVFEHGRRVGTDLAFLITRFGGFGDRAVSPAVVQFVEDMGARTPVDVMAEFYETFTGHDKLAALAVLVDVDVVVVAGEKDLITPAGPQPGDGRRAAGGRAGGRSRVPATWSRWSARAGHGAVRGLLDRVRHAEPRAS
jgi:hypothetical protein